MNEVFESFLSEHNIALSPGQRDKLSVFEKALLEKNSVMNLISPKDEKMIKTRHVLDSLAAVPVIIKLIKQGMINPGALIADCGSGAGFPGMPLAVAFPDFSFHLLDSLNKRCVFLNDAAAKAGISNVQAMHSRLGEGKPKPSYSLMTERAMGKLENIMPLCAKELKKGGHFLAWQSLAQVSSDRPELNKAMLKAGLRQAGKFAYRLPAEENEKYILIFVKI